ncbi:MAG: diguanylate cyclase domain-containing protein [Solirubrobacterales bacterium]
MIRLANVLIVDAERKRADALAKRLMDAGYHATVVDTSAAATKVLVEHPDFVLVGSPDVEPVEFGRRIKAIDDYEDIPVVLIAEKVTPDLCSAAYENGLDDVLADGCDDGELLARLRPLGRLATMHAELRQRAATAQRFGVMARDRADGPTAGRPSILVIGDAPGPVRTLLAEDAEVTLAATLYEGQDLLSRTNFDAAVVSFTADPDGLDAFCAQVRHNPRLFNLPLVVVADASASAAEAYRRGATRVLSRPLDPTVLRTAILTLVRRQKLRWAIRSALDDSLAPATRDPLTGSYNRGFLEPYLDARLAAASSRHRHVSVVFFSTPSIASVRSQFGDDAGNHLLQQVGQWISGLLRAEDLTALFADNEFCVVLSDTPLAEAEVVMHRIAGVLAYTDFAVREVYQPVKVWVQVGATDIRAGDSVPTLLARARQLLD